MFKIIMYIWHYVLMVEISVKKCYYRQQLPIIEIIF